MSIPSNLIPVRITKLPTDPDPSSDGWLMYVHNGTTYKIQIASVLNVSGVAVDRQVLSGTGLTGGGDLTSDRTISIATGGVSSTELDETGVTPGSYGSGTKVPVINVDSNGRVTTVSLADVEVTGFVATDRQVVAGTGLEGGGTLSADVTFNVIFCVSPPLSSFQTGVVGTENTIARGDHQHPAVDLSNDDEINNILGLASGGTARSLVMNPGAIIWSGADGFHVGSSGQQGQVLLSNAQNGYTWGSTLDVLGEQPQHYVFAAPSDAAGEPYYRLLVESDLPNLAGTYLPLHATADTALALNTSRNIKLTGDVTGNINFDGTVDVDIATVVGNDTHSHDAANLTGTTLASNVIGSSLTSLGTIVDLQATDVTLSNSLKGPSNFLIDPAAYGNNTGTVVIGGDLQVDGTTTTINSTIVTVEDKNIELATGATDALAANGSGITVDCGVDPNAEITYDGVGDLFAVNKDLFASNLSGTNTGDQDLSHLLTTNTTTVKTAGTLRINDDLLLALGSSNDVAHSWDTTTSIYKINVLTGDVNLNIGDHFAIRDRDNSFATTFDFASDTGDLDITGDLTANNVSGTNTGDNAVNTLYSGLVSNVTTNLSTTHNASTVVINSSDGTNATINAATATTAGIMSEAIYDEHVVNNAKVSDINHNVTTNLGYTTAASTGTVTSSDGTNATLPAATTSLAGLLTATDKTKLDSTLTTGTSFGGDVSGTYNAISVTNDSHTHNRTVAGGEIAILTYADLPVGLSGRPVGAGTDQGITYGATITINANSNRGFQLSGNKLGSLYIRGIEAVAPGGFNDWHKVYSELDKPTLSELGYSGATNANYFTYTHPTYTARTESKDTGTLSGATVINDLDFNITTDTQGHVTACDITTLSTRELTAGDIGAAATSHTHTGSTISALDAGDTTTGIFDTARIPTGISITGSSASCTGNAATATTATNLSGGTISALAGSVVEVGRYMDFHYDSALDYDVRFEVSNAASTGAGSLTLSASGGFICTGNVTAYSDERVKTNIEIIPNALDKISKISGYTFDRTDANVPRQTGVIAQELEKVLPEAVIQGETEDDMKSVAYGNIVGLLIEGIKEQQATISAQDEEIQSLQEQINGIRSFLNMT